MINYPLHPSAIVLEKHECHVIFEAIRNNWKTIEFLKNILSENKVRLFTEIFKNTIKLVFIPTEEEKIFYKYILLSEKNRLEKIRSRCYCNQNHLDTIEKIAALLKINLMEN